MPEPAMVLFSFQELATLMIKQQDIHEGLWGVFVRFGIGAANAAEPSGQLLPTALVPVKEIGLQRFDELNNLTVDAAVVNPRPSLGPEKKKSLLKKTLTKRAD